MIADKLTVVIPCKNEAGYIEDTLRSLKLPMHDRLMELSTS